MTESKKPKFFYGYIIVLATFGIMVTAFGTIYSFGVFLKPILAEFGWTRAIASGAYSLYRFLHTFLMIIMGGLVDRFGPRMVMMVCGFFLGLGFILMSQINAIWQLYLFYGVIISIGMSASYVPPLSTVARWFVKRRGMMSGLVVSGVGFGMMIMPPIANHLISNYGWRTSYIVFGIMALALIMLAAVFLKRDPSEIGQLPDGEKEVREEYSRSEASGFSLRQAAYTRQFWLMGAALFGSFFAEDIIIVHIVIHTAGLGISAASAANMLVVIGGGSIAGRIIMGGASDRIGAKTALVICFILMAVTFLWLIGAKETWMFYLFAAIFGFAYGGVTPLFSPLVAELFGLRSHGLIFGICIFIGSIGGGIGAAAAGRIFDVTGSYQPAFLACSVLTIVSAILILLVRPNSNKRGKQTPEETPDLSASSRTEGF